MDVELAKNWIETYNGFIQENKEKLTELDTPIGDGDHGNNMSRGLNAVMEVTENSEAESGSEILKNAAMQLISKVGGASGPLYGTAFLNMSNAVKDSEDMAEIFKIGLDGIQKRGKADVGEKTMVDMWDAAVKLEKDDNLSYESIDEAVEATRDTKATKGRASYVGVRSVGVIDPGTYSSALLFKAFIDVRGGK